MSASGDVIIGGRRVLARCKLFENLGLGAAPCAESDPGATAAKIARDCGGRYLTIEYVRRAAISAII